LLCKPKEKTMRSNSLTFAIGLFYLIFSAHTQAAGFPNANLHKMQVVVDNRH